jgi:alginate O-acetyltransferase complex protein AlgI
MAFSSPAFIFAFLPIFLAVYYAVPRPLRNTWILVASLLFYFVEAGSLTAILCASIVVNWLAALYLDSAGARARKFALAAGIAANLIPLLYYKYWTFFIQVANDTMTASGTSIQFRIADVLLPAGISFFTFHAMSYLVDVYQGKVRPARSVLDFGMYMANFPQLIAGPIVRYSEIASVVRTRPVGVDAAFAGLFLFAVGLAKKIVIADNAGVVANAVFALPHAELATATAWLGAFAYSLQIYFDFSGYSDMAIGLGLMMGFRFPENFDQPYRSRNITEFWRRWHMTLSRWFRDYVYIPLGGNRAGRSRTLANLLIVFILCGLWHGASYTFLVWGLYHGALLVIEREAASRWGFAPSGLAGQVFTFLLVMIGWVFFRSNSLPLALDYLAVMAGFAQTSGIAAIGIRADQVAWLAVGAMCAVFPVERIKPAGQTAWRTGLQGTTALVLVLFSCALIAANGFNPFIYFRF